MLAEPGDRLMVNKEKFPTDLDCFKCCQKAQNLKHGETNPIAEKCHAIQKCNAEHYTLVRSDNE